MENPLDGMALRAFVRDTIIDVIKGVHEAADSIKDDHATELVFGAVNPKSNAATNNLEFDIAVTVSRTAQGSFGVHVPILSAKGERETAAEQTHRIRFEVPIAFASQPVGEEYTSVGPPGPDTL